MLTAKQPSASASISSRFHFNASASAQASTNAAKRLANKAQRCSASAAARSFWKLPEAVQESLTRKLYLYGLTGEGDAKRMVGSSVVRMRDGDYRVVFEEAADGLTILAVGHRREIYR
jgi:mRNA interferase RelE/StbE